MKPRVDSDIPTEAEVEEFRFRDAIQDAGFAQCWHAITLDTALSDGALRTYLVYLKYAQQDGHCWPSRARIAADRGKSPATISRHNAELERLGYVTRTRRLDRVSTTWIEDVWFIPRIQAIAQALMQARRGDRPDVTE